MEFDLNKAVNNLGKELRGNYGGFFKFLNENNQVEQDMNEEGIKQGYWNEEIATWQDYLLDSPNAGEVINEWNEAHTLEVEYKLRKKNVLSAFAVVMTEWFYEKMQNETDQKIKNKWYEQFEDVRRYNWGKKAEDVYGTYQNADGDTTSNLRSWAKSTDGNNAYDYGLTFADAIKWMMTEGIKPIPPNIPNKKNKNKINNGWKNVGFCQRYVGNDPNELKKVGLGQRYFG